MTDAPLPPTLELLVELIGEAAALRLAAAKGGQRVYIPGRIKHNHWLVDLIGRDAAEALARHFNNGEFIVIPQGPTGTLAQVQRVMRRRRSEALARGLSANQVAAVSGYSVRQIYRTRARQRRQDARGQGDLFSSDDTDTV